MRTGVEVEALVWLGGDRRVFLFDRLAEAFDIEPDNRAGGPRNVPCPVVHVPISTRVWVLSAGVPLTAGGIRLFYH